MDSNQDLVGLSRSVGRFGTHRLHIVGLAVEAVVNVSSHCADRVEFHVLDGPLGTPSRSSDALALVQDVVQTLD